MADRLFVVPGQGDAPFSFELPAALEFRPKIARASFDASGGGGSFKPCLRIISDSGHIVYEAVADTTVAAGGSADVSWFRGVAGGAASASTTNAEWFLAQRTTNLTMLAGVTDTIPWTTLDSSNSSLFSFGNQHHPNDSVSVSQAGVIIFQAYALPNNLEPNFPIAIALNSDNGVSSGSNTPYNQGDTLGLTPPASATFGPTDTAINIPDAVPFKVYAQLTNFDGVNRKVALSQMWGVWWPIGTLSPF